MNTKSRITIFLICLIYWTPMIAGRYLVFREYFFLFTSTSDKYKISSPKDFAAFKLTMQIMAKKHPKTVHMRLMVAE